MVSSILSVFLLKFFFLGWKGAFGGTKLLNYLQTELLCNWALFRFSIESKFMDDPHNFFQV